jgi:hypothetical protein
MRKEEIWDAAHEVAIHTRTAEGLIESTLVELAELQSKLVRVSDVAGVSYSTLQQSFEGVAATINEMVKVRGIMADCHRQFVEAKDFIPGLRTVAWGDGSPCKCVIARADLRVVG